MQLRINEAGIPEYQFKLARNDRDMLYIRKTKDGKNVDTGPQPFSLRQTIAIFMIYGIFLSISMAAFFIEIFVGSFKKKLDMKKPVLLFDEIYRKKISRKILSNINE